MKITVTLNMPTSTTNPAGARRAAELLERAGALLQEKQKAAGRGGTLPRDIELPMHPRATDSVVVTVDD